MVCPDLDSQVCILDREYKVVVQLGDGRRFKTGKLAHAGGSRVRIPRRAIHLTPHAAIFLHSGDILVAEWCQSGVSRCCAASESARMTSRTTYRCVVSAYFI